MEIDRIRGLYEKNKSSYNEIVTKLDAYPCNTPNEYYKNKLINDDYNNLFRGSREKILQRCHERFELVSKYIDFDNLSLKSIDLGCGRGEWLEVLVNHGLKAIGVDYMLHKSSRNISNYIIEGEIFDVLNNKLTEKFDVFSFFHVLEHLDINSLCRLLETIKSVGNTKFKVIIELPNVYNPFVSSTSFYNDPTHRNKLPLEFLEHILNVFDYSIIHKTFLGVNQSHKEFLNTGNETRFFSQDIMLIAEHCN